MTKKSRIWGLVGCRRFLSYENGCTAAAISRSEKLDKEAKSARQVD